MHMQVGTILFCYNRSRHLGEVLAGLRKNQGLTKLYIFQDGLKCEEHRLEWEKVKAEIEDIDWCIKEYHLSPYNKGLACSIVDGINTVLKENDAVIVLEDDCVPTANFISFMHQCFEKYHEDKRVYSVSGYSYPIELEKSEWDVYGCGRISSWGWGTWKDRWQIYQKDYEMVKKMKQDKVLSQWLATWGRDLENMLVNNVRGQGDSWAVFWALAVIMRNGICINPYKSFIRNIGMDGSGVHCGTTQRFEVECISEERCEFILPDEISMLRNTACAFAPLFGSYTAVNEPNSEKEKVLVYGTGNFFLRYEKEVNRDFYIEKFVDTYKKGYFCGKEIIKAESIHECNYDKILIMVQNTQECSRIIQNLLAQNIDNQKITLGSMLYGEKYHANTGK